MKFIFSILLSFLFILCISDNAQTQKPVVLEDSNESYNPGLSLYIFEDVKGVYKIEDFNGNEKINNLIHDKFYQSKDLSPNFNFSESVFWLKFSLKNKSILTENWYLELSYPLMDTAELYIIHQDKSVESIKAGRKYPFSHRPVTHRNILFKIKLKKGETGLCYLRLKAEDAMIIPLSLHSAENFIKKDHNEQMFFGIFFGFLIVMIFYNIFLYLSFRELSYLFFCITLITSLLFIMSENGFAYEYLWSNYPGFYRWSSPFFISISLLFLILFSREFLLTKKHLPFSDKILLFNIIAAAGNGILSPVIIVKYTGTIIMIMAVFSFIILLISAIRISFMGYKPAFFYIVAFLLGMSGITIYVFSIMNILPVNFVTTHSIYLGYSFLVILFTLALADKINILNKEKRMNAEELSIARKIQMSLIPRELPVIPHLNISARYIPMNSVGGDFYDFHIHENRGLSVIVADVTGHGVPAALIASMVKIVFIIQKNISHMPEKFLCEMNRLLSGNIESQFLTAAYLYINPEQKEVLYSSAGHEPLLVHKNETGELIEHRPRGRLIGWTSDYKYTTETFSINKGDRIIMYTDGITECMNSRHELFGEENFRKFIIDNITQSLEVFSENLISCLREFTGNMEFNDDLTFVIIDVI